MDKQISILYDIDIPTRDGVLLRANVFGPADDEPYPAILILFPYLKDAFEFKWGRFNPLPIAAAGYRVVMTDCRGTGHSQGEMDFDAPCQSKDGYDAVEWIAAQPWSDGNICMYGFSYFGFTQLLTGQTQPPHLKAICPWQQTGLYKYSGGFTTGPLHLSWLLERTRDRLLSPECTTDPTEKKRMLEQVSYYLEHFVETAMFMPEAENPAANIDGIPFLADYSRRIREHDDPACPAREGRPVDFSKITIPCFFLGGWYDETSKNGPIENWMAISALPDGASRLAHCKMLMGPWNHGTDMPAMVGCRNFGTQAESPMGKSITEHLIRWFDYHLKGIDNGLYEEPPIMIFEMGKNRWRYFDTWPVPGITQKSMYLHSDGNAGTVQNSGKLPETPGTDSSDIFVYDPRKPVPSRVPGVPSSECQDQSPLEAREDVLVYTSAVLEDELEVLGNVLVELYVSSSCPDTDFMCKVTEVFPNGFSVNITDGAVRASYNNTYNRKFLQPGEIRKVLVDLGNTCNVFQKGSRIRLTVTGSNFPKFDRNHNTEMRIGACTQPVPAQNTIYHGGGTPSRLILPILPKEMSV